MDSRVLLLMFLVVLVTPFSECHRNRPKNQCPDPGSYGRNCFVYRDQCQNSRQCRTAGQKCCLVAGCGRECVDVASTAQAGSCPDPASYGRACIQYVDQCQTAADCGDGGACCLVAGCGKECTRPNLKPNCPPPSGQVGICVIGPNSCVSDTECASGQLCCSEGCGSECKNPV